MKAIDYNDEAEVASDVTSLLSRFGVLFQAPFTLFHWRDLVDEITAARVHNGVDDGVDAFASWEAAK